MAVMDEDAVVGVLDLNDAAERIINDVTVLFARAPTVAIVEDRRIVDGRGRVMGALLVGEDRLDAKGDPDLAEAGVGAVERPALPPVSGKLSL